jgi:hypothetical protein
LAWSWDVTLPAYTGFGGRIVVTVSWAYRFAESIEISSVPRHAFTDPVD